MGRIAGANGVETRRRLLRAAADVFARRGYDGTRVADIAAEAGLSNSALYAYFTSKAELLLGALRTHGRRPLAELVEAEPDRSIVDLFLRTGADLRETPQADRYLVIEALVAARHDPEVASAMTDYVRERAEWMTGLIEQAQLRGEIDATVSPRAIAHLATALGIGSTLLTTDLHDVTDEEWTALLTRVITSVARTEEQMGTRT
ncbi:TetR/AcrR family transcriptional regulator [Blastococcus sp. CCUG 61487]|uniref:TetR/AcrR family transcriptional regulator n=1 Tax=Blastococcus sp. CCUG 61487 TaxID=1840703 RepID=UPI001135B548|nr:TetR/AcrR family transcriptional regulator [Blastococcus sp. CCUG 61487]TKJ34385.1 transcriptional regulator [Blastococcus sp. CCUG 61487]